MKNSIFKKLMSFVATVAILATSTVVAMAENDYASQSTDCGTNANWTVDGYSGVNAGAKHTLSNGVLKSERSMFRVANAAAYGIEGATGAQWIQADGNGGWMIVPPTTSGIQYGESANRVSYYLFGDKKSFSKGKVQIKFDFMFEGSDGQNINVGFNNSTDHNGYVVGARIGKESMRIWYPTDYTSNPYYYTTDHTKLEDNVWYTCTMFYDIEASKEYVTITNANGFNFAISEVITSTNWGSRTKGNVDGVKFCTYRDYDLFGTTASSTPASSVWYIDNVALDAFTETNYAVENVYRDAAGLETNTKVDGFDFKGYALTRFTNIADFADAKFITAAYDADGRMENVVTTPLSAVGTTPIHSTVAGDVVKSFIFGMDNATPHMSVYTYADPATTVRKYDFEDGYTAPGTGKGVAITKVAEGDNNIIKFERTGFGSGYRIAYTDGEWKQTTDSPDAKWLTLELDRTVNSYEASFKVKFAGFNNPAGYQSCQFNLGGVKDSPALIQRKSDGKVSVSTDYDGEKSDMFVLADNEWCEVNLKVTFGGEPYVVTDSKGNQTTVSDTKLEWTFKKDGVVVATFSQTINRQNLSAGTNKVYIGSRKDNDMIGLAKNMTDFTGYNTTSSVWYIDDLVVKY